MAKIPALLVATLVLTATACTDASVTEAPAVPLSVSADAMVGSGFIELPGLGLIGDDARANAIRSLPKGKAMVVGAAATIDTSLYRNEKAVYWTLLERTQAGCGRKNPDDLGYGQRDPRRSTHVAR